jgi:hypothetical protein
VGPFDTLGRAKWAAAPRAGVDREADREIADDTDNCGGDTGQRAGQRPAVAQPLNVGAPGEMNRKLGTKVTHVTSSEARTPCSVPKTGRAGPRTGVSVRLRRFAGTR